MRSQLSNWYNQFWMPFKYYISYMIRSIRKKDEDDNQFNNPFVIF
jgi:predicted nucleotide-binding protein (sugar kinase/HSP70/actin superfamily)